MLYMGKQEFRYKVRGCHDLDNLSGRGSLKNFKQVDGVFKEKQISAMDEKGFVI